MSIVNFYKKQTVLNDILKNQNIVLINNIQLNNVINTSSKGQYDVLNQQEIENGVDYQTSSNYLTKLYISHYNVRTPLTISNSEIIENIKYYNNFKNNLEQDNTYTNFTTSYITNSLVFDYTYNKLYYIQPNKVNLMTYLLDIKNGLNYKNHMLYLNIDNEYIRSINNTLYYNFNKIRETSTNDNGVSLLDNKYINTKNISHHNFDNYQHHHGILSINKDFKYNVFISLNKLKSLYYKCEDMYNTLSYYVTNDDYYNDYLDFVKYNYKADDIVLWKKNENMSNAHYTYYQMFQSYYHTSYDVKFENTKLYITDLGLGINNLDISDEETIYISDLNNVSFKIETIPTYITSYNYSYYKNSMSLSIENNNINYKLSYICDYKYFTVPITSNFIETSSTIFENQVKTTITQIIKDSITKYPISTTYNIYIESDIDKNIFNNSGLTIKYQSSPYLDKYELVKDLDTSLNDENSENFIYTSYSNYSNNDKINIWTSYIYNLYHHDQIVLPIIKELNVRKINNNIKTHYYSYVACHLSSFKNSTNGYSYYILSSKKLLDYQNIISNDNNKNDKIIIGNYIDNNEYNYDFIDNIIDDEDHQIYLKTNQIDINNILIEKLKSKKLLIPENVINKLYYYKVLSFYDGENNKYECYPVLNSYPHKYLNDKFFDSEIYKSDNYPNDEELNTCISEIKNIFYDNLKNEYTNKDNKILYLYEINCTNDSNKLICYSLINNQNKVIENSKKIKSFDYHGISDCLLYYDDEINSTNLLNTKFDFENQEDKGYWYLYKYLSLYLNHSIRLY